MFDSEIIGAIIGPFLTGFLAIFAYGYREWQTRRRWESERENALQQALGEVKYVDTWLSALNRLELEPAEFEEYRARALKDLERSYEVMAVDLADDGPRPRTRTLIEHIGAVFLVPLHRPAAKVARGFYYVSLLCALGWLVAVIATIENPSMVESIGASIIVSAIGFVPPWIVHIIARALDRPRKQHVPHPQHTAPQAGSIPPPFPPQQFPRPPFSPQPFSPGLQDQRPGPPRR